MTDMQAAPLVQALMDRQRDLLVAIAVTEEALTQKREELTAVRARLEGVQLGRALAAEAQALAAQEQTQTDG